MKNIDVKAIEKVIKEGRFGEKEVEELLLGDKQVLEKIGKKSRELQRLLLQFMDKYICNMLIEIKNCKREMTLQEMEKCSKYFKDFFGMSLEKNYDTEEITALFCITKDFTNPDRKYNPMPKGQKKQTIDFVKKVCEENQVFDKYLLKLFNSLDKINLKEEMDIGEFEIYDNICRLVIYRNPVDSDENIRIMKVLEKKSKELKTRSETIENQIEIYIEQWITQAKAPEQREFYNIIMRYYTRQMKGSALEINENAAISHLIKAVQQGRLKVDKVNKKGIMDRAIDVIKGKTHQDISDFVLKQVEKRKKRSRILKKSITDIANTKSIKKYIKYIAEIRLQQGRMPQNCCDFMIKQAVLKNEYLNEYSGLLERTIEDFTEYQLESSGNNNYFVAVEEQEFLPSVHTNGIHSGQNKRIRFSRRLSGIEKIPQLLEVAFHECAHADESKRIINYQANGDIYKIIKETILSMKMSGYEHEYSHRFSEVIAFKTGRIKRLKYLKSIGITDEQIKELDIISAEETVDEYRESYERANQKKLGEETKDLNVIFLEFLQQKTEILDKCPILNLEFEKQGGSVQRKSFAKILKSFEQMINEAKDSKEKQRISSLFSEILLNGVDITEDKLQQELDELMLFHSDNPIINAFKNKIKKIKFSNDMITVATIKYAYKNIPAQQRSSIQQEIKEGLQGDDVQVPIIPNQSSKEK